MKSLIKAILAIVVAPQALVACNSEPAMDKQEYADKSAMTTIAYNAYRDKKDWNSLSESDKSTFIKFYKTDAASKVAFDKIIGGLQYMSGGGGPKGATVPPTR